MTFGEVLLDDALGAILAHAVRLPSGVLKKGRQLAKDDIARLRAAGLGSVIAARLEADDVREDEAAQRLAQAVAGDGVRVADAATGRANLFAARRGLLVFEREGLHAINASNEALTLATAAQCQFVERGDMIATVKIIPFAVDAAALERCCTLALSSPLRVAALGKPRAGLLLTRLSGVAESLLDRASQSQQARLRFLGGHIVSERRCDHDVAAVAGELRTLVGAGCDPILVLGASAIVDRRDIIPRAIEHAGGHVDHLGMPVDPGNLLLLGRCGGATVIGVPGCARSLKRSGFDQVLERVVADLPVTSTDIAGMAEGGLLKDHSDRPHPRKGAARARKETTVAAVLLAAGQSRRMPQANKLLEHVDGEPMVVRVVRSLQASRTKRLVVVIGHEHERIREALSEFDLRFVFNPDFGAGMSTSVRAGVDALGEDVDAALFALGDMPWIRSAHIDALVDAFEGAGDAAICVPVFNRKRGNPVLWSSRYFSEMRALSGDVGARRLIEQHRDEVRLVDMQDAAILIDVDTPEELAGVTDTETRAW